MSIASKPIILIVDDDISILKTFARIFNKKGFSVTVAENGEQAIEKLKTTRFDIALIDFGLPDMEGTALFPLIEKLSPKTVRILLTGKTFWRVRLSVRMLL
ncbi:response regulator [Candidatus Bathyarchaeota archaeon]|nr:response regulator [Candidatus Bathyarchaeota archaeon]